MIKPGPKLVMGLAMNMKIASFGLPAPAFRSACDSRLELLVAGRSHGALMTVILLAHFFSLQT